jgi:hypothetical protein
VHPRRWITATLSCSAVLVAVLWVAPSLARVRTSASSEAASDATSSTNAVPAPQPPDTVAGGTDPVSLPTPSVEVSLPTPSVEVSLPTPSVSDAVGDATATVSAATGVVSGTTGDATGAGSGAALPGAGAVGAQRGVHPAAVAAAQTRAREGQDPSACDPQGACGGGDESGPIARAIQRVLDFLAETGFTLLPWIALAAGLAALGIVLVRASRRRTSRT